MCTVSWRSFGEHQQHQQQNPNNWKVKIEEKNENENQNPFSFSTELLLVMNNSDLYATRQCHLYLCETHRVFELSLMKMTVKHFRKYFTSNCTYIKFTFCTRKELRQNTPIYGIGDATFKQLRGINTSLLIPSHGLSTHEAAEFNEKNASEWKQ